MLNLPFLLACLIPLSRKDSVVDAARPDLISLKNITASMKKIKPYDIVFYDRQIFLFSWQETKEKPLNKRRDSLPNNSLMPRLNANHGLTMKFLIL